MRMRRVHYNIFSLILIRHDGRVDITGCGCLEGIGLEVRGYGAGMKSKNWV
jgi:hypothetical protein